MANYDVTMYTTDTAENKFNCPTCLFSFPRNWKWKHLEGVVPRARGYEIGQLRYRGGLLVPHQSNLSLSLVSVGWFLRARRRRRRPTSIRPCPRQNCCSVCVKGDCGRVPLSTLTATWLTTTKHRAELYLLHTLDGWKTHISKKEEEIAHSL